MMIVRVCSESVRLWLLMYTGPLTCHSTVLDEVVSINCIGPDNLPPSTIQCAVNNMPPFNCEILCLHYFSYISLLCCCYRHLSLWSQSEVSSLRGPYVHCCPEWDCNSKQDPTHWRSSILPSSWEFCFGLLHTITFNSIELELYFVNDTPLLNVDTVHAEIQSNRPGAQLDIQCHLTHFDYFRINCKSIIVITWWWLFLAF